jgi:methanogenic corrinoid protein MtbC1
MKQQAYYIATLMTYLEGASRLDDIGFFLHYIAWMRSMMDSRGIDSSRYLENVLDVMYNLLEEESRDELFAQLRPHLEKAREELFQALPEPASLLNPNAPRYTLAKRYFDHLLAGERHQAVSLIVEAAKNGMPIRDIYLFIFDPVQKEVGRQWQLNRITVAHEHYATAVTQLAMSQLYPFLFSSKEKQHRMVATCIGSELHELGIRMVADLFELSGWDTHFLGANTPHEEMLAVVAKQQAKLVALSMTILSDLDELEELVVRLHEASPDVKILVGGYPFAIAPSLWKRIGADGYAHNALEGIKLAKQLISA